MFDRAAKALSGKSVPRMFDYPGLHDDWIDAQPGKAELERWILNKPIDFFGELGSEKYALSNSNRKLDKDYSEGYLADIAFWKERYGEDCYSNNKDYPLPRVGHWAK